MADFLGDVRFGGRMLLKHFRITAIAVVGLAFGVGLTGAMFSIVYGTVLRGMPFEGSERLMYIERRDLVGSVRELNPKEHDFLDWREQQTSFEDLAAFTRETFNLSGPGGPPERYEGASISTNLFPMLGVQPFRGRNFTSADADRRSESVALISHALWQKRFNADEGLIGQMIWIDGEPVRVVGILPRKFKFPLFQDVWTPLRLDPLGAERGEGLPVEVIGRLKPEVSLSQARAEFDTLGQRLEAAYPATNRNIRPLIRPYITVMLSEQAVGLLYTMLGASFGVLVIACVNVANLLLARASLRTREVAIRSSLGANRRQVISQFLVESFVLALAGGAVGLLLAKVTIDLFSRSMEGLSIPFWFQIEIDLIALLVILGLILTAALLSGSIPAIRASRADLSRLLKDQARGSSSLRMGRFSRALVVAEVALSCGLLVASGLMIKSIVSLSSFDFGFLTREILTAQIALPDRGYPDGPVQVRFFDELTRRISERPGVEGAALVSTLPAVGAGSRYFAVEGKAYPQESDYPNAGLVVVSPRFFETFGVQVRQGREFTSGDAPGSLPVAVVNESFVKKFASDGNVLGSRIRVGRSDSSEPWMTIVGVVPDMLVGPVQSQDQAGIYTPLAQQPRTQMSIVVRGAGNALNLSSSVREEVATLDRNLPVFGVKSMEQVIKDNTWFYRVFGALFMAFGLMALLLAAIGLYGVMAFSVSRRTHEIGTRMALGADRNAVLKLILKQGSGQLMAGLGLGLLFALALSRLLGVLLFGVQPWDPGVFTLVAMVLIATGLLACLFPARAAVRVSPMVALRNE